MGIVDVLASFVDSDLDILLTDCHLRSADDLEICLLPFLERERGNVDFTEIYVLHFRLRAQLVVDTLPQIVSDD